MSQQELEADNMSDEIMILYFFIRLYTDDVASVMSALPSKLSFSCCCVIALRVVNILYNLFTVLL